MRNRFIDFLWSLINSIYYSGKDVLCQLCGWEGVAFVNDRCPKCNSLPRQRLIPYCYELMKFKPKKILHVGPNKSEYFFIKHKLKPESYDRVDIVNNPYSNLKHDITKTGLKINYYDFVVIWHVLEHISNDREAIKNLELSLSNEGKMLVSVPIYPKGNKVTYEDDSIGIDKYGEIHGHPDHFRSCGYDYVKRLNSAGFNNIVTVYGKKIDQIKKNRFGLSNNHVAWICQK